MGGSMGFQWRERVVVSPDLHHGDPCIRGTRIPVATILGSLADGMTAEDIREAYPQLTQVDIQAALAYAADSVYLDLSLPLAA
jgi:uncharacterized protein (DUF433 family)